MRLPNMRFVCQLCRISSHSLWQALIGCHYRVVCLAHAPSHHLTPPPIPHTPTGMNLPAWMTAEGGAAAAAVGGGGGGGDGGVGLGAPPVAPAGSHVGTAAPGGAAGYGGHGGYAAPPPGGAAGAYVPPPKQQAPPPGHGLSGYAAPPPPPFAVAAAAPQAYAPPPQLPQGELKRALNREAPVQAVDIPLKQRIREPRNYQWQSRGDLGRGSNFDAVPVVGLEPPPIAITAAALHGVRGHLDSHHGHGHGSSGAGAARGAGAGAGGRGGANPYGPDSRLVDREQATRHARR